jgi:hypothetical protein
MVPKLLLRPARAAPPDLSSSELNLLVSFLGWGGVRLSPLGTSATNWPIVPAPDDR